MTQSKSFGCIFLSRFLLLPWEHFPKSSILGWLDLESFLLHVWKSITSLLEVRTWNFVIFLEWSRLTCWSHWNIHGTVAQLTPLGLGAKLGVHKEKQTSEAVPTQRGRDQLYGGPLIWTMADTAPALNLVLCQPSINPIIPFIRAGRKGLCFLNPLLRCR